MADNTSDYIKFTTMSSADFNNITTKDPNTVYFVESSSSNDIYVGDVKYGSTESFSGFNSVSINEDNIVFGGTSSSKISIADLLNSKTGQQYIGEKIESEVDEKLENISTDESSFINLSDGDKIQASIVNNKIGLKLQSSNKTIVATKDYVSSTVRDKVNSMLGSASLTKPGVVCVDTSIVESTAYDGKKYPVIKAFSSLNEGVDTYIPNPATDCIGFTIGSDTIKYWDLTNKTTQKPSSGMYMTCVDYKEDGEPIFTRPLYAQNKVSNGVYPVWSKYINEENWGTDNYFSVEEDSFLYYNSNGASYKLYIKNNGTDKSTFDAITDTTSDESQASKDSGSENIQENNADKGLYINSKIPLEIIQEIVAYIDRDKKYLELYCGDNEEIVIRFILMYDLSDETLYNKRSNKKAGLVPMLSSLDYSADNYFLSGTGWKYNETMSSLLSDSGNMKMLYNLLNGETISVETGNLQKLSTLLSFFKLSDNETALTESDISETIADNTAVYWRDEQDIYTLTANNSLDENCIIGYGELDSSVQSGTSTIYYINIINRNTLSVASISSIALYKYAKVYDEDTGEESYKDVQVAKTIATSIGTSLSMVDDSNNTYSITIS